MHIKNLHHRHFVALPVAALVLGVAFVTGQGQPAFMTASVADQTVTAHEPVPFITPDGHYGTFGEGSMTIAPGGITMTDGSLLLASRGFSHVTIGPDLAVTSFNGSLSLNRSGDRTTIAAITAPAVLRVAGAYVIVPTGYQGTWSAFPAGPQAMAGLIPAMRQLPKDFVLQSLQDLEKAKPASSESESQAQVILPFQPGPILISEDAQERARQEWAAATVNAIIKQGRQGLLAPESVTETLMASLEGTASLSERASDLVSSTVSVPSALLRFLPLVTDPAERLLAYVHPQLRAAAWIALDPATDDAAVQSALTHAMLLTDTAAEQMPQGVLARWTPFASAVLAEGSDAHVFFEQTVPFVATHLARMQRQGYPERFASALAALNALTGNAPAGTSLAALEELRQVSALPLTDPILEAASSSSESSVPSVVSAPEPLGVREKVVLEAKTRQLLTKAGAVFSMQTAVTAVMAHQVDVTGIVFSDASSEHIYRFSFNPETQVVSSIVRDGEEMLYPLNIDAFTAWARGMKEEVGSLKGER